VSKWGGFELHFPVEEPFVYRVTVKILSTWTTLQFIVQNLGPGTEDGSHASAQLLGKITHKVVLLHKKNLGMEQGNCLKSV